MLVRTLQSETDEAHRKRGHRRVGLPLALMCLVALGSCASSGTEERAASVPERNRGNATVRAAVYAEAAANVATPAPTPVSEPASASKAVAARGKQDKRAAQSSKKDTRAAAPTSPRKIASGSDATGRVIDPRLPLSATGYRYTYAVEMDGGGTRTFGFATDQGMLVGDRVLVNDTGVVLVRN